MNKAKAGAITALVLAGFVTTGFELHATRELRTELRALRGEADLERLERERRRLAGELAAVGNQPELDELTRLNQRIAALQARPPGLAHNLKPIGNPGRATPVEAFESFCWALNSRDLDVVASFISFTDDTPENRETFMARLGPVLREKYRTAERVCAAAFFPGIIVSNWPQDPAVALAVTEVRADGLGQIRVQATLRLASGKETESRDRFRRTTEGWLLASGELTDAKLQEFVASRLDPVTGESRAK